jgi:hypothetical protein
MNTRSVSLLAALLACALSAPTAPALARQDSPNRPVDPDADYDRLDGTGQSGKRVDVVEWEENLEIHVYPQGSLKGLGLKIDEKNGKRVMVILYRFDNAPQKTLVRRAVLGIDLKPGFKTFKDPTADGYDKVVISNNGLSRPLVAFKLDAEPKQLYPDGHPALAAKEKPEERAPASRPADPPAKDHIDPQTEDTGTIQPFFTRQRDQETRK